MPASTFTDSELGHLRAHLDKWRELKALPNSGPHKHEKRKQKDELVEIACAAFFKAFPQRDPYQDDAGPNTFTDAQVRHFPKTIRQWLNNNTKDTPSAPAKGSALPSKSRKTARHIAQKRYATQIEQSAKVMVSERPEMHILTARNLATTACIQRLQEDRPEEWAKLEQLASDIRTANALDFTDQKPDVLQDLLKGFPKVLLNQTTEWSRTMGVLIYTMAIFSTPEDPTLKSYLVLSPRLNSLHGTPTDELLRNNLLDWIEDNLGSRSNRAEQVAPTVYPDRAGDLRPRLPEVEDVKAHDRILLRTWVRLYLNYLWQWLGGKGPIPWKKIGRADSEDYVEFVRLPSGIDCLCDPHLWTRAQIVAWYMHLVAGQRGELSRANIFQFLRVDRGNGAPPLFYRELCLSKPAASTLQWGPDEKLYALQVEGAGSKSVHTSSWCGLPLARTQAVYVPFDHGLKAVILGLSTSQVRLGRLCELLSEMERLGPVHTSPPDLLNGLNHHLPSGLPDDRLRSYVTDDWLPVAFFDDSNPDWFSLALPSLMTWIQSDNQFRHIQSNTWRGGPTGVRWIVAVLARCTATFTLLSHDDEIPTDIQKHFRASDHARNWEQLARICTWLVDSLERSNLRLKQTFTERATAWKAAIIKAHLAASLTPSDEQGHATSASDGIPTSAEELRSIYQALTQTDPDMTLGDEEYVDQMPQPTPGLPTRSRTASRRSPLEDDAEFTGESSSSDTEEIQLPSDSSSDESSSLFDEADTAFANESFQIAADKDSESDGADDQQADEVDERSNILRSADTQSSALESNPLSADIPDANEDQHEAETGDEQDLAASTTSNAGGETSEPIATRRTRRNVVVNERVKEAIKSAKKGKYI